MKSEFYKKTERLFLTLLSGMVLFTAVSCEKKKDEETYPDAPTVFVGMDSETDEETAPETEKTEVFDFSEISIPETKPENGQAAYFLALPETTAECSDLLALQSLILSTGNTADMTAAILENAGFTVLTQKHFDKEPDAADHTCAFTVAEKTVLYHDEPRTLFLLAVRGTSGGEWYSNFDLIPSGTRDVFAENFLFCAEDAFLTLDEYAAQTDRPLFLICGHSRGAACANLLGLLVNSVYGAENTFVYTFASPMTICGDPGVTENNIFNYINPLDLVPYLPPDAWGFRRAGTDILLPGNTEKEAEYNEAMEILRTLAPTPESYYTVRHSLTEAGGSEDGMTPYEVFLLIGKALAGNAQNNTDSSADVFSIISEDSDFYPLADLIAGLFENDSERGLAVLSQHLPNVYAQLIEER